MVIPGYREGTLKEHCGNCRAYKPERIAKTKFVKSVGECTMFKVTVERKKTCDEWSPRA